MDSLSSFFNHLLQGVQLVLGVLGVLDFMWQTHPTALIFKGLILLNYLFTIPLLLKWKNSRFFFLLYGFSLIYVALKLFVPNWFYALYDPLSIRVQVVIDFILGLYFPLLSVFLFFQFFQRLHVLLNLLGLLVSIPYLILVLEGVLKFLQYF
jgi:hypothetical protein